MPSRSAMTVRSVPSGDLEKDKRHDGLGPCCTLEVLEAMQAAGVDDRVRDAAETIYQALIDAEPTSVIGAGPGERRPERSAQRSGSRPRTLTTIVGDLELRIPKLRNGSFS